MSDLNILSACIADESESIDSINLADVGIEQTDTKNEKLKTARK